MASLPETTDDLQQKTLEHTNARTGVLTDMLTDVLSHMSTTDLPSSG